MSADFCPLRHLDQAHRPFPPSAWRPQVTEVFSLNGKGWCSPELTELLRDFGSELVRQACDDLDLDPRRQNIPALRTRLEAMEARLK